MSDRHAIVAGATGIVGRRVLERLASRGWRVTGLCRSPPAGVRSRYVAVDLANADDCRDKLRAARDATHFIYAARYDHPEGVAESVDTNVAMLRNAIEAIEPHAPALRHVHLVHGTKYYGHMLGPGATPYIEDGPRAAVSNFYFDQEDWIRERARGKAWAYSTSRPHTFCDSDADEPRNVALLIAVYATLARALNQPLNFPGSNAAFDARTQFTYVPLLAEAIEWITTSGAGENTSFNVTNGDSPTWRELWPRFAEHFGVEPGAPRGFRLGDYAADKGAVWDTLVAAHGLRKTDLAARVLWPYADYVFKPEWDIVSSMAKARRAGFAASVDTAAMFVRLFEGFSTDRIIP